MSWVIEFRNGSFFQNLEADHGGPSTTAQRFASEQEADAFIEQHFWMNLHGAMPKKISS